jgi:hypothetical protein
MTSPRDVSDQPAGSVTEGGSYLLSLTGAHSHTLTREPGLARLALGSGAADLHVDPDDAIDWTAFDPFATPAGSAWPRHLDYRGNDSGFFAWARRRPIENLSWRPVFDDVRRVDAAGAGIHSLFLKLDELTGALHLALPDTSMLSIAGDLGRLTTEGPLPTTLAVLPALGRGTDGAVTLPHLGPLADVRSVILSGKPLARPISLRSLAAFREITTLSLWGSFTDWDALAELSALETLEIRFAPDLEGMPSLDTWPRLESFIAFNIDAGAGKRLRSEMRARAKTRPWEGYTSVVKLREPDWWQTEYGRPFSGWDSRRAKRANAAYDAAVAAIAGAGTVDDVRDAVVAFVDGFNAVPGIETTEREDLGDAVVQFAALDRAVALGVNADIALEWFEQTRDF